MKSSSKKKIAFIIAALVSGGAEKQLIYLIKNLNRKFYNPQIISFSNGIWEKKFRELNVPITIIDKPNIKIFKTIKLVSYLISEKFDIVHNYGHTANLIGRLAAILAGISIIIVSERNSPRYIKSKKVMVIERILAPFTNALIANSTHGAKFWIENKLIRKNKAWTVLNGIEQSKLSKIKREDNTIKLINVGDLRDQKNQIFMIESIKSILLENKLIRLEIIGDGPLRNKIKKVIEKNKLSNSITLKGYVENVRNELINSDIYIHTAIHEGLPNAVMEAMSCGLPCLVTNADGCNEVIDNKKNGIITEFDEYKFAEKLSMLIKNKVLRDNMGKEAKRKMNKFSIDKFVLLNESIYDNLLKQNK